MDYDLYIILREILRRQDRMMEKLDIKEEEDILEEDEEDEDDGEGIRINKRE